jgi:hypothetical protein
MTRSRSFFVMSGLALTLAVAGCGAGAGASNDPFYQNANRAGFDDPIRITIENNDYRDATIYAYWNGVRDRIGMVTGKTTQTFTADWKAERLYLSIDFVGRGGYRTESIDVWAGDHLNYVILPGS